MVELEPSHPFSTELQKAESSRSCLREVGCASVDQDDGKIEGARGLSNDERLTLFTQQPGLFDYFIGNDRTGVSETSAGVATKGPTHLINTN